ncbi:MAG: aminoacetone oxidase family FAD-binding enzyme [Lachnospiraceae bacterium]|nr:aminoacetone oxidase family FAD-binding enzyme [Lachnospiraceae bacterium]
MEASKCHKLIIVGCGAAGMMAGCIAGLYCDDVLILDANNVPGKKLLATGNGRCNFTNIFISRDRYNMPKSDISDTVMDITEKFSFEDVLLFFEKLGVPVRIINEYCYPYSLEAVSIRDALYERLQELNVKVKLNNRIARIEKDNDREVFSLYTDGDYCYEAKKVILACAGKAGGAFGCDGSIYDILNSLGAKDIVKPLPALCGLASDSRMLKNLAGVRARAKVKLYFGEECRQESGEIIFSEKGISGIPVMNLSRYAVRAIEYGKNCRLSLDFFEDLSNEALQGMIRNMVNGRKVRMETALTGILNHKLLETVLKECGCFGLMSTDENIRTDKLVSLIKDFSFNITGTAGWDNAQVTTGGLSIGEIDPETLETTFCPGLYVVGETLDVDGCCGGYNLQWAWSTGAIAGAASTAGKLEKDKILM